MSSLREQVARAIMENRAVDNWGDPLPSDYELADAAIAAGASVRVKQLERGGASSGWIIDPSLLMEVTHEIDLEGWEASLEVVELAMLAAEKRILSALEPTNSEGD